MEITLLILFLVAAGCGMYDTIINRPVKTEMPASPTYYRIYVRFADRSKPKTFYCHEDSLETYKEWLSGQDISFIQFTEISRLDAWKYLLSGK